MLVLCAGCLNRVPQQKAASETPIAIGWALEADRSGDPVPAPGKLKSAMTAALGDRNLKVVDTGDVDAPRLTARRLEALRAKEPSGWILLVEARASFFSQLEGRYRWTVAVKLTASSKPGEVVEDSFSAPAILQYEHEREPQAIAAVARDLAQRAGTLLDGLLLAAPAPAAARSGPGGLVYFVMVDRFANGDPSNDGAIDLNDPAAFHGGDLQGVLDRLDWLQSLGVRTVWLSPVFAMRPDKYGPYGAFHGYWTWDLTKLEPRFGDEALLSKLGDALHARGMRLVLDLVLNHVGPDAPLVKEKPDWFHRKGGITDWNDAKQLTDFDVHGLPDLATEREDVYRHLLNASLKWARVAKADGFRLDAVKHVPLSFWARFSADVRKATRPNFELLGEMLDGDPAVVAAVQRDGGFTSMFDFPLHFALVDVFCKGQSAARLGSILTSDRLYPSPGTLTTLADNHDLPRLMTQCGAASKDALAFLLTARGAPSIIWGTEAGLAGEKDPLNRASMTFTDHPLKAEIAKWTALRAANPALDTGATEILEASKDVFAVLRLLDDQAALVVFNRTQLDWKSDLGRVGPNQLGVVPLKGDFRARAAAARAFAEGRAPVREIRLFAKGAPAGDVRIVGSGPELGSWQPERGVVAGHSAKLPVGGIFELKLAVKTSAGWRWQGGDNVVLKVQPASEQVELQWSEG